MNDIMAKYTTVDELERAVLKAEYTKLVAESQTLLPELRTAAEAAFTADPNKNADVTRRK